MFNPQTQKTLGDAYINNLTDVQSARNEGAFDTWENLVLNPEMVSDEYLEQQRQAVAALAAEEQRKTEEIEGKQTRYNEYAENMDNWAVHSDLKNLLGMAQQIQGNEAAGFDAVVNSYAENWGVNADELVSVLVGMDNAINQTNNDPSYLAQLDESSRSQEIIRMLEQYGQITDKVGEYPENPYNYEAIPYDALMTRLETQAESNEFMEPLINAMLSDPNVYELSGYIPSETGYVLPTIRSRTNSRARTAAERYDVANMDADDFYHYINDVDEIMLTDLEKAAYNYYYNTGDFQTATEYMETMKTFASQRERVIDRADWEFLATDNAVTGALMTAGTFAANVASAVTTPFTAADETINGRDPNPNVFADFTTAARK